MFIDGHDTLVLNHDFQGQSIRRVRGGGGLPPPPIFFLAEGVATCVRVRCNMG